MRKTIRDYGILRTFAAKCANYDYREAKTHPYGMQNWEDVRLDNFYYVDKTRFLALPGIGEADGIAPATVGSAFAADNAAGWFSLDGRRLAPQPAKPGVYVNGARKVVVR